MKSIKLQNYIWAIVFPLYLLLSMVAGFSVSYAQNETFSWTNYNTIHIKTPGFTGPTDNKLTKQNSSLPGSSEFFSGVYDDPVNKCEVFLRLSLVSNSSGKIVEAKPQSYFGAPGGTIPTQCNSQIIASWQNRSVIITGTRPSFAQQTETLGQKKVEFIVLSSLKANQLPSSITVSIDGPSKSTLVLNRQSTADGFKYSGNIALEAGTYTACGNAVMTCVDFTKVRHVPKTVTQGETSNNRKIKVSLEITVLGNLNEVGAIEITLRDTNDQQVGTAQTNPVSVSSNPIGLSSGSSLTSTLYTKTEFANVDPGKYKVCVGSSSNCNDVTKVNNQEAATTLKMTSDEVTNPGSGATQPSCESSGGELSWILCPVLRMASNAITALDNQINTLLEVPNKYYENTASADQLRDTWARLRNLAYILLIPILLVAVIGTALGFEFISAYTVKKALPRLVAAVIFMSLSYEITTFLITLTNDIGKGMMGLLTSSFSQGNISLASLFDPGFAAGGIFTVALGVGGVLAAGIIPIILSYAFVVSLTLLIVFLILSLRQMVLITLVLIAPLAILAWIFPGNDKLWKMWWGAFSKLLMLFPLIAILVASGRVFASIVQDTGESGFLETILKLTAYIGPYFFIPQAFKLAGGVFATVAGIANDRSKGLFDRQKKFRQGQYAKKWQDAKGGNYYRGNSALSRGLSHVVQGAALSGKAGLRPSKWRDNLATARTANDYETATEFLEKNMAARAIKGDDDKLWAVMNGRNEEEVRAILKKRAPDRFSDPVVLNKAVSEVMRFKKEAGDRVGIVAATVAQAGTGTGFNYRHDGVNDDMLTAVINASGDDRGLSGRMLADMRQKALQSGRVDLAGGGFAKQAIVLDKLRVAYGNGGKILKKDKDGKVVGEETYTIKDARTEILQDVLQSNAGAAVAGKVEAVKELAPVMKANIDKVMAKGDSVQTARELAKLAGKYDAASQIAPQNAEALADGVLVKTIDVSTLDKDIRKILDGAITEYKTEELQVPDPTTGGLRLERRSVPVRTKDTITYQQAIEALRGNPDFQTMRREYQSAGVAAAEAQARQQPGGGLPNPGNYKAPGS